ncbi:Spy/CpxP family protein refolding chaperone [Ideonella sp. DXS29W]|uniref:Spy/CpxP family protein refolding chaperone n=1 Tax=Ideonella lacteola TaxID=2984193 RepID=A0ABU9BTW6_9BURK
MNTTTHTFPRAWRYVAAGLALSAVAAFSLVNLASAHARPDGAPPAGMHQGPGFGMPGMGLPMAGPMMDRMLDEIQATPAQREQLRQLAESARADLKTPMEAARADHEKMAELFAQPTVDAAAVESLRKKMLARHDQVSKRMNVAMLDAAKVLTPEQRQQMASLAKQHAERMADRRAERMGPGADAAAH